MCDSMLDNALLGSLLWGYPSTAAKCLKVVVLLFKNYLNRDRVVGKVSELEQFFLDCITTYLTVLLFPVHSLLFAGHHGSFQSDLCTNTGFGSFKLLTCGWLQKGQSHSHMYMESQLTLVVGTCCMCMGLGSLHAILHVLLRHQSYGI